MLEKKPPNEVAPEKLFTDWVALLNFIDVSALPIAFTVNSSSIESLKVFSRNRKLAKLTELSFEVASEQ
jgi:hypothetical protein